MAHVKTRESNKSSSDSKRSLETTAKATPHDRVRAAVKRRLEVLASPDAARKLRAAFNATSKELAAAANAAEARRKR